MKHPRIHKWMYVKSDVVGLRSLLTSGVHVEPLIELKGDIYKSRLARIMQILVSVRVTPHRLCQRLRDVIARLCEIF